MLTCRSCGKKITSDRYVLITTNLKENPLNDLDTLHNEDGYLVWVYCLKCNFELEIINQDGCPSCGLDLNVCQCLKGVK